MTSNTIGWTREMARDLFPVPVMPYAWTFLRAPAEASLRRALTELGAPAPAAPALWRRDAAGSVLVDAAALGAAFQPLGRVAWLVVPRPQLAQGLVARLHGGGFVRRAQARINTALIEVGVTHERLARWLMWSRGLRWTQADVLQVMEELEPNAEAALLGYFILRAALTAAQAQLDDMLAESVAGACGALFAGLPGLPTVEAAYALTEAARAPQDAPARVAALVRFGHRGPGEIRPDAHRWQDHPELLASLAEASQVRRREDAEAVRAAVESDISARLGSRAQAFHSTLEHARQLCRAVDIAWDSLTLVAAVAGAWSRAVAVEATEAGLITTREDVCFLELEELKQVATGEWHRGFSAEVQDEVARRAAAIRQPVLTGNVSRPVAVGPGVGSGPAFLDSPVKATPPPQAIWAAPEIDPGGAPFWLAASGLVAGSPDVQSPGVIAARSLALPIVVGAGAVIARLHSGEQVVVDGDVGAVRLTGE